eukprot:617791-Pyramimonas_sp.AAC.1
MNSDLRSRAPRRSRGSSEARATAGHPPPRPLRSAPRSPAALARREPRRGRPRRPRARSIPAALGE